MRNFFWFYLVTAPLLLLSGACDNMKQEVNLELPEHTEEFVVECYLEPGNNYRALLTRSVDFFESKKLEGVDSATVRIFTADEEKELQNTQYADTLYKKVYNYWHPEEVEFEEGQEYFISISYGDEIKASGKTKFLPKAYMDSLYFKVNEEDTLTSIFVDIKDNPQEENYYRVVMKGPDPSVATAYDGIWSDENAENGIVTAYSDYHFKPGWTVVINVYHIDKEYYDFLDSVHKARDANYNPFMQPSKVQSTLEGATGVFTAVSRTSDTVKVKGM